MFQKIFPGYVPKGQHFFGQRYAQACDNALKSFEADLIVKEKSEETLKVSYCVYNESSVAIITPR